MLRRVTFGTLLSIWLAGARPAAAQLTPFVMGDLPNQTWLGGEVGVGTADFADLSMIHLTGLFEWALNPTTEIYGRVPMARVENDFFDGSTLGNITVGGRMIWPSPGSNNTWSAHAAVSLPTASDSGDSGAAAGVMAAFELPHDGGWWAPETSTLRVGGNFGLQQQSFFLQAELGLHFLFVDNSDDALLLKYAFAAGVGVGTALAIVGEISGYSDALDDDTFGNDDTRTSIDLGVRWRGQSILVGGRLYLPLDEVYRDDDVIGLMVDVRADL